VLSFLTQLDGALKPEKAKEDANFPAHSKPKIELQIANRAKHLQDGYQSALPLETLD